MKRKVFVSMFVLATLAIASIGGVVLYRSANAATPAFVVPAILDMGAGRGGPGRGLDGSASSEQLASALGISVDEMNAVYQKANEAALAQAVTDGLITQAQADQLKANGEAFPFGGRWAGWLKQQGIDYDTFLAQALGITVEKLQAAYLQAFNTQIDQSVTDGQLTQDQANLMKGEHALFANQTFKTSIQTAFESAVKQAVTDGVITQVQADAILKAQSEKGSGMVIPFMGFPGGGHHMGGRQVGPGWGGQPPAPNSGGQTIPYPPVATPAATPATNY
jgi:hypothetical protein